MSTIGKFSFFITWFTRQELSQQDWSSFRSICSIFTLLQTSNASTLFQDEIWDHSFLASIFLTVWVCDQKSNQNGTSTFLLQLEVIAPKRAPSRMCFFDLYFEVPWRPRDLLFQKETRRARPQANDRRHKEPRGRVFSRKVTELKVLQVSKNGLMKKRLLSFSISVFIQGHPTRI